MSENTPQSVTNPFVGVQKTAADTQNIKLVQAPPEVIAKGVIEGRITAQENGRVTIATDQGDVIIEAKIAAEIGQKIQVKLQQTAQKIVDDLTLAQLQKTAMTKETATTEKPTAPPATNVTQDRVQMMRSVDMRAYESLQTRLVSLLTALSKETFDILTKTMLQLPLAKALPQTLVEGFDKFRQLSDLLVQARLVPQNTLNATAPDGKVQPDMLTSLMQILKPSDAGTGLKAGQFWTQNPLGFLQLQAIPPGQSLSPNILLDIRQQLMNVLNPSTDFLQQMGSLQTGTKTPLGAMVKQTQDVLQTFVPQKLQAFFGASTAPTSSADKATALYTLPMTGMILGQVPQALAAGISAPSQPMTLILMATPQGQNLIGYVLSNAQTDAAKPSQIMIPGTVMVMAMPPQTTPVLQMPSMIGMLPALSPEALQALHPAFGKNWPALESVWDEVLSNPSVQADMAVNMRALIPSATAQQMTPALLLFMAVIKGGFGDQWVDEKLQETLQQIGKEKALSQLSQDIRAIRQAMDDGPVEAWKPLPMPFQQNDQLMRVQWYYRHQYDTPDNMGAQDDAAQKNHKTRFIVDVPQTRLGDIQIDGLVHDMALDIVLRTEGPILAQAEKAIRERYHKALEISGTAGNVQFQSGRDHYVRV